MNGFNSEEYTVLLGLRLSRGICWKCKFDEIGMSTYIVFRLEHNIKNIILIEDRSEVLLLLVEKEPTDILLLLRLG